MLTEHGKYTMCTTSCAQSQTRNGLRLAPSLRPVGLAERSAATLLLRVAAASPGKERREEIQLLFRARVHRLTYANFCYILLHLRGSFRSYDSLLFAEKMLEELHSLSFHCAY